MDRHFTSASNRKLSAFAALALAGLAFGGNAQARDDVYWSLGVGSPGVTIGVSNSRPVYVAPAPVYMQPAPIYVPPRVVYIQPAPVYVQPSPYYQSGWAPPGRAHGWHKKHDREGRHGGGDHHGYGHGRPQPYAYGPGYGHVHPGYAQPGQWHR